MVFDVKLELTVGMADKIKPLTEDELAEARRLKALFNANKPRHQLTQEKLGDLMGTTQGAISHYLNGRMRISDYTLLRLAHFLKFDPEDVRPGIIDRLPKLNETQDLSALALQFAREFDELPEQDQQMLVQLLSRVRTSEPR